MILTAQAHVALRQHPRVICHGVRVKQALLLLLDLLFWLLLSCGDHGLLADQSGQLGRIFDLVARFGLQEVLDLTCFQAMIQHHSLDEGLAARHEVLRPTHPVA